MALSNNCLITPTVSTFSSLTWNVQLQWFYWWFVKKSTGPNNSSPSFCEFGKNCFFYLRYATSYIMYDIQAHNRIIYSTYEYDTILPSECTTATNRTLWIPQSNQIDLSFFEPPLLLHWPYSKCLCATWTMLIAAKNLTTFWKSPKELQQEDHSRSLVRTAESH